jgi:hypothetical protein
MGKCLKSVHDIAMVISIRKHPLWRGNLQEVSKLRGVPEESEVETEMGRGQVEANPDHH